MSFFLFLLLGEVEEGINFCPLQPCCCVTLPWKIQLLHCRVLLTEGMSAVGGWGWLNHKGRSTLFHLITAAINERLKGFASLLIRKDNCSSSISSYRDSSITGGFCRIWPTVSKFQVVRPWRAAIFKNKGGFFPFFLCCPAWNTISASETAWHWYPLDTVQPETRTRGKPYF